MSPVAVLLAVVVCYYAGPLFKDQALAHYIMSGWLVAVLMCKIAHDNGRAWWPVCIYGAARELELGADFALAAGLIAALQPMFLFGR